MSVSDPPVSISLHFLPVLLAISVLLDISPSLLGWKVHLMLEFKLWLAKLGPKCVLAVYAAPCPGPGQIGQVVAPDQQ